MDNAELRRAALERFPVLAELPEEMIHRLMDRSHLRTAPAGTVLFEANTPCSAFPLLLEGSVREFISRLLHSFANRGWVKLERERIIVLDPKSLAGLAGG